MAGSMTGMTLNNRYQLIERVGIGGMAEVYRAHDTVLDRVVAVKVMLPQYAADLSSALSPGSCIGGKTAEPLYREHL